MKILLTGGSGQIGRAFCELAPAHWSVIAPRRSTMDLTDARSIERAFHEHWDIVISAGAYTAVDQAEKDPETAWRTNADGIAQLGKSAFASGIPVLHLSTDYVFDGRKYESYLEDDPINPLGEYGRSKAAGEAAIREQNPSHIILRTAWVVSPFGRNFLMTILNLSKDRSELRVVNDQCGSPSSAHDIARALLTVLKFAKSRSDIWGTYHFVNSGSATWFQLARYFLEVMPHTGILPKVTPISATEYPSHAQRPANSRLDTSKFQRIFGVVPRPWKSAVKEIVEYLSEVSERQT